MMYVAFPALIVAMLAYMFFHASFSMRRARIVGERRERRRRWVTKREAPRLLG